MSIIIYRNQASNKYCEKAEIRLLGKAGRLARMFAKSRQQKIKKGKPDRVKTALVMLPIPSKSQIEKAAAQFQAVKPNYHKGEITVNTVRATQKIRRGCRELVRI
ncbi:hypothetical protein [Avibacterium paragallinarum]|uniref:hypothetical protein n=1 Tax=Avibacterium paragallinarum TaxID=728 RepID=UPI001CF93E96|nr:hypothetical protein [Avibacterium paragallinarum]WAL56728.1 hypothetical protein OY678_12565 [Avibacterium paragallinarum]WAM59253.1 hypothetical protein OW731_12285 [Avibacterium paragallinarum]